MKNGLTDLNNILFAQLERLSDEDMSLEDLKKEECRTKLVNDTALNIIRNGELAFKAVKYQHECEYNGEKMPRMFNITKDSPEAKACKNEVLQ